VGEDVLITGAGPSGIMAANVARHAGARYVIITDVNEYRLNIARQMGVTRAVNVAEENLPDIMKDLHMLEGFDIGLEISRIITHRLPINDFQKGFEIMASGQSGKVLLYWD
jgi:threonine 3-dehydrogenase